MAWFQAAVHGTRVLRSPRQRLIGADDLLGLSVVAADGAPLGEIRDLMLDMPRGLIEQRFQLRAPGAARIAQTRGLVLHPSFEC